MIAGDPAWVSWEGHRPDMIAAVLAIPEADLYEPRDGYWYRPGEPLARLQCGAIGHRGVARPGRRARPLHGRQTLET